MMLIEVDTPEGMWAKYYARKALEIVEAEIRTAQEAVEDAKERLADRQANLDYLLERAKGARHLASLAGIEEEE